jgi:predicted esterase
MTIHEGQPVITAGAPLGQSRGVIVMVHGRNASPQNILTLVPALDRPAFTCVAPAAAGHTWYPHGFMTETEKNEPYLSSALHVLDALVDEIARQGVALDRVVLLGFSQGACLISEFSVRHARRYGGIIALSGGLIGPPGTTWPYEGTFDGTPVFLGCSDRDAHIPKDRVTESAEVFSRMGAAVTARLYPNMGHLVSEDEIVAARAILDGVGG